MPQTLITGATGLIAHQRKLDVVANNIANINTNSYKSQRAHFSDLIYEITRQATGPTSDINGGTNPHQIGNGVAVSQISKDFGQGVLTSTGGQFDFAIQGDGFFVVDGENQNFTRDGSFAVDSSGYLVDPANGGFVQRIGVAGEGDNDQPALQEAGDTRIAIPLGESVPGRSTSVSSFIGNLPATATPPLIEILATREPYTAGGTAATDVTLLNDLDSNNLGYQAGDAIEVVGTNADGSAFSVSLPVDPTTTLGDLVASLNGEFTDATAALSAAGNIVVTADSEGESLLSVNLNDGDTNVGSSNFSDNSFYVETDGKFGDTVESTIQIFDQRGQAHNVHATFEKRDGNSWDATFRSGSDGLELEDSLVTGITFNPDGTFQTANGLDDGDANIELRIDSFDDTQIIDISLDRLTHIATSYTATFNQDGYPPGNIINMNVSQTGVLMGIATNGQQVEIAQLAIARFSNNHGLESVGQNYYSQTSNSGIPDIGPAGASGTGDVRGGQLEASNVDVALEFTQLIVAQRGFSANARTITVATEILEELNNILR